MASRSPASSMTSCGPLTFSSWSSPPDATTCASLPSSASGLVTHAFIAAQAAAAAAISATAPVIATTITAVVAACSLESAAARSESISLFSA